MSQDDIHRTLQANLPPSAMAENKPNPHLHPSAHGAAASNNGNHHPVPPGQHPVDLNPMDFIEHDVVAAPPPPAAAAAAAASAASAAGSPPFGEVHLEAFDMLNEFSDTNSKCFRYSYEYRISIA